MIASLKLWARELLAREFLVPVEPRFCILWDDPAEPDAPVKVTHPSPRWLAMALVGGFLPPVETYWRDAERGDDEPKEHPYAHPIGPMSEAEAMEYLVMKDIPRRVWSEPSNRPRFAIVPRSSIPTDRTNRNAWRLADFTTRATA